MSVKIIFVIGGARSGKSSFALNKAAEIEGPRAYIATGEALDDEMKERIQKHKDDRGMEWSTYEEPVRLTETLLSSHGKYNVIVIDCLTLWLSNVMIRTKNTDNRKQTADRRQEVIYENMKEFVHTLDQIKNSSVSSLKSGFCNLYIVSNEVGMGIVPENPLAREFRDLAGFLNQRVAEAADEVYMVTVGIPIKIK